VGWPAAMIVTLVAFFYANRALKVVPGFTSIFDLLEEADEKR